MNVTLEHQSECWVGDELGTCWLNKQVLQYKSAFMRESSEFLNNKRREYTYRFRWKYPVNNDNPPLSFMLNMTTCLQNFVQNPYPDWKTSTTLFRNSEWSLNELVLLLLLLQKQPSSVYYRCNNYEFSKCTFEWTLKCDVHKLSHLNCLITWGKFEIKKIIWCLCYYLWW